MFSETNAGRFYGRLFTQYLPMPGAFDMHSGLHFVDPGYSEIRSDWPSALNTFATSHHSDWDHSVLAPVS
ncbi:hypothetical protein EBB79_02325 [Parasedimentitalea marina]|uniref:Uncharacterized protein n=1 Tax=Parasedimentitalea marina TaxID=2483033 RepID=A0A3T0MYJ6_9RHOB|nr:hypothetical protein EBB79_02325 [Parasedimentitalea marina]